jgi:hypothetical protein
VQVVDTDKHENLTVRNNRVSVYRPVVTNESRKVSPVRYRNAETVRTEQKNLRTTETKTTRYTETKADTRKSNQTTRETGASRVKTQAVKRSPSEERTVNNNKTNKSLGRLTNKTSSGSVKINQPEANKKTVNRNANRQGDANQNSKVRNQKPEPSNNLTYKRNSPASGSDHGTRK